MFPRKLSVSEKDTTPTNDADFFRREVFHDIKNKNYGSVSINVPVKYTIVTLGICGLIVLIVLFFIFAEYSEKMIVKGYINSTKGIIRVYPNKNGVIVKSWIHQGSRVNKGDRLFLIDTSYHGLLKNSHLAVFNQLMKRHRLAEKDIQYKKERIAELKPLLDKKYVALDSYYQQRDELNALIANRHMIEMDLIRYKQNRSYVVRSPISGIVASVIFQQGQAVNLSKPLVKIIPSKADLIAEVFIPMNKSGFLSKNKQAIIRFDAYPFERFGTVKGIVTSVSQSILTDEEDDKPFRLNQPYYKAVVTLNVPFLSIYGAKIPVQHGMTVSAVILGEKKKIWKWILDPLYSYCGELFV